MNGQFVWEFFSCFGDVSYWLGFSISFLLIYPLLSRKDKMRIRWILTDLIPIILISYLIVVCLKFLFLVPRPCLGLENCPLTPSFPSGHAAIAFAFSTVVVARMRERKYFLFFGLAFLVALSRVMLGLHTSIDVIGGGIVGLVVGYIGIAAKKIKLNWFYHRKIIHFLTITIFPIEFFFGRKIVAALILLISLLYFISEIFRIKAIRFPILQDITKACCSQEELKKFVIKPLYLALGILVLVLAFPKHSFYFGGIAMIIGDSMAGIFGKKFGKIKIPYNKKKTLEGSTAFFCSTFLLFLLLTNFLPALILAILATVIESLFVKYENFILPISIGALSLLIY